MKVKANKLSDQEKIETLDALYTAASTLKGRDAMKMFLRDLLTESERLMLGRRILIARHILAGDTHDHIVETLGVGYDTVGKVHRWLRDEMPGYEEALAGLEDAYAQRSRKKTEFGSMAYLKKKYPLHFLFFPWPDRAKKS